MLGERTIDGEALWGRYPPEPFHPGKRTLFDAAGGHQRTPRGPIVVSRWASSEVGSLGPSLGAAVRTSEGPLPYPPAQAGTSDWNVNFADDQLFAFSGGVAFGQDEIQVVEHPVLASVRRWLLALGDPALAPLTRAEGAATPILVQGAERWCAIDTDPPLAEPFGIYGRLFVRASEAALRQAVTRLPHPSRSNILAMAAPRGTGLYAPAQIDDLLVTAITGFAAAKACAAGQRIRVWTGHWGTGAYGGDRVLCAAAQLLAARFVGIDALELRSIDDDGHAAFQHAQRLVETFPAGTALGSVVAQLHAHRFRWGTPDGN